jgi:hypothetical protein
VLAFVRADLHDPLIIVPFRLAMEIAKATENSRTRAIGVPDASSLGIGELRRPQTMNALTPNANAVIIDGFDAVARDATASPIRGQSTRFKDGAYYDLAEEIDVSGRRFVVLDRLDGWQKLAEARPPEYLMQKPGEPPPPRPHVEEKDWPLNLNGVPEHPCRWTHYLYLLDEATGEIMTLWTNTFGGGKAIDQLTDQVTFMRRVRPDAIPVIALQSKEMPTRHGGSQPRPHFKILGWKVRGSVGPQGLLTGPEQKGAEQQTNAEPTTKDILNDDLPF